MNDQWISVGVLPDVTTIIKFSSITAIEYGTTHNPSVGKDPNGKPFAVIYLDGGCSVRLFDAGVSEFKEKLKYFSL